MYTMIMSADPIASAGIGRSPVTVRQAVSVRKNVPMNSVRYFGTASPFRA